MNYYKRFRQLRYRKDARLAADTPKQILWIDEDMLEGMTLGRSMRRVLSTVFPETPPIVHSGHEGAIDRLLESSYIFIILDNDLYRGTAQGPGTLGEIKKIDEETPIIYTTSMPDEINDDIRGRVSEVIRTNDLPRRMAELIEKYSKEE
jgi:hypothetical protein